MKNEVILLMALKVKRDTFKKYKAVILNPEQYPERASDVIRDFLENCGCPIPVIVVSEEEEK